MSDSLLLDLARLDLALRWAQARLTGHSPSARLDTEVLLGHVLKAERAFLYAHPELSLTQAQARQYHRLIERRVRGEPIAYLTGRRAFWSFDLQVTPEVLIPRPETEQVVATALELIDPDHPMRLADLGTGSGAIALALASERPAAQVLAHDLSYAALHVARLNAQALGITNVQFVQGDWCTPLGEQTLDLIVANPPYIAEQDPHLAADGVCFEPRLALIAGDDGLRALDCIIKQAPRCLREGGYIVLEHGFDQGPAVREKLAMQGFACIRTRRDLSGLERVTVGCHKA